MVSPAVAEMSRAVCRAEVQGNSKEPVYDGWVWLQGSPSLSKEEFGRHP